jgi:hypothetical protein
MNYIYVKHRLLQLSMKELLSLSRYFNIRTTQSGGNYVKNEMVNRLLRGGAARHPNLDARIRTTNLYSEYPSFTKQNEWKHLLLFNRWDAEMTYNLVEQVPAWFNVGERRLLLYSGNVVRNLTPPVRKEDGQIEYDDLTDVERNKPDGDQGYNIHCCMSMGAEVRNPLNEMNEAIYCSISKNLNWISENASEQIVICDIDLSNRDQLALFCTIFKGSIKKIKSDWPEHGRLDETDMIMLRTVLTPEPDVGREQELRDIAIQLD